MAGYRVWRRIGLWLFGAFATIALPAEALAAADPFPLSLTCYGEVDVHKVGNQPAPQVADHGYVEVRLSRGDTRIQLPQGFRSKPDDNGWYKIKYLKTSDEDIIGNAIISFIDKPFFRIERLSGRIDVTGLGATFTGDCRETGR